MWVVWRYRALGGRQRWTLSRVRPSPKKNKTRIVICDNEAVQSGVQDVVSTVLAFVFDFVICILCFCISSVV